MERVVKMISLDDMHPENIWFSWYKPSNYQEKLIRHACDKDSTAVSIFVVILVELTNTVFVNSINTTNNETGALSTVTGRTEDGRTESGK